MKLVLPKWVGVVTALFTVLGAVNLETLAGATSPEVAKVLVSLSAFATLFSKALTDKDGDGIPDILEEDGK